MRSLSNIRDFEGSRGVHSPGMSNFTMIDFTIELLVGCNRHCPGCFVNRKLPFTEKDLEICHSIVEMWIDRGLVFNELILGPTDVFDASNFREIIGNVHFREMSKHFSLVVSSTLMAPHDTISKKIKSLEEFVPSWAAEDYELIVPIDVVRYYDVDDEYTNNLEHNLSLFNIDNIYFVVNVSTAPSFLATDLLELETSLRSRFGTRFNMVPSYARNKRSRHVECHASIHAAISQQLMETDYSNIQLNVADAYFGGCTLPGFTYANHELYVSPFVYDRVPDTSSIFKIPRSANGYTMNDIQNTLNRLFYEQYNYTKYTTECNDCEFLPSCVSKHILSYMESRKIVNCLIPRKTLQYPPHSRRK